MAPRFSDCLVRFLLGTIVGLPGENRGDGQGEAGEEWAGQGVGNGEDAHGNGRSLVQAAKLESPGGREVANFSKVF